MTITLNNEADILLWTFIKLIATFRGKQYLFAAQRVWWISTLRGLYSALVNFIDNQRLPCEAESGGIRQPTIASTNIQRLDDTGSIASHSEDLRLDQVLEQANVRFGKSVADRDPYVTNPVRQTRDGRLNSSPSTNANLNKARWIKKQ